MSDAPTTTTFAADAPVLSILIPAYNERATIRQVIEKVRGTPFPAPIEIIVVDDGSCDGTREVLRELPHWDGVRVFYHERNGGKGAAVQTAMSQARGRYVVIQDADLELEPRDLVSLFEVVRQGEAEVCFGSRFLGDNSSMLAMPTYWANRVLNLTCNLLNRIHISDMNTCYKMMRTDVARRINLVSRGFAMEPEITTKLARMGVRIVERPISYRPRARTDGKKIRSTDFFRYLKAMVRFRFTNDRQLTYRDDGLGLRGLPGDGSR